MMVSVTCLSTMKDAITMEENVVMNELIQMEVAT